MGRKGCAVCKSCWLTTVPLSTDYIQCWSVHVLMPFNAAVQMSYILHFTTTSDLAIIAWVMARMKMY